MSKRLDRTINQYINQITGSPLEKRARVGRLAGWWSIWVNLGLFITKLLIGLLINSIALLADAIHSVSDVITSLVLIVGYKITTKPADPKHPYGHQRAEYIASLIIALLIALAGFEFIKSAIERIREPHINPIGPGVFIFVIITIVVKLAMATLAKGLGGSVNSAAIKADAIHHYSDALGSGFVLLAILGSQLGIPELDGVGGIMVGLILLWAGYTIAKEAADSILGKPPSDKLIRKIQSLSKSADEVLAIHDIVVHRYGFQQFISLHLEVNSKMDLAAAHNVAEKVRQKISKEIGAYVTIHVDPVETDNPFLNQVEKYLHGLIDQRGDIKEFHDLRLVHQQGKQLVLLDLVPHKSAYTKTKEIESRRWIKNKLQRRFPDWGIVINIDPIYTHN